MSDAVMSVPEQYGGRAARLDRVLGDLLRAEPELEAAAVVSFDGLAMASALPPGMDEDRVAAMSAALLSLGEKAAAGLGRGDLSQVYVEGDHGTVFLVSADDEAVLVAVAGAGAKTGLVLYEIRHAAAAVAAVLVEDVAAPAPAVVVDVPDVATVTALPTAPPPVWDAPEAAPPAWGAPVAPPPAWDVAPEAPATADPVLAPPPWITPPAPAGPAGAWTG